MAIKEIKREWSPCQLDYVKTYLLHSEADVKDLPKCCVGSKATVSETDNEYYCTESGWKLGSELGGGSSEVVILPETTLMGNEAGMPLLNPLAGTPKVGGTYTVTYNGTDYKCQAMLSEMDGTDSIMLGNSDALGIPGGNTEAPFVILLFPEGAEMAEDGTMIYAVIADLNGATSATLSIVQTAGASGGGATDSPVVIAKMTGSGDAISIDKTFDEIVALVTSGKIVYLQSLSATSATTLLLTNYTGSSTPKTLSFAAPIAGGMIVNVTYTPDGATMEIKNY